MSQERPEQGEKITPATENGNETLAQEKAPIDSPTAEYPKIKSSDVTRKEAPSKSAANAEKSPKKGKKKRKKAIPWVAIVLILCVAVAAVGGVSFGRDLTVPADAANQEVIDVEIEAGMPVADMGKMLEDNGIIRSATAFKLYVRVQGAAPKIQAGIHSLSPSMTLEDIVVNLQEGAKTAGVVTVSVAEGLTVDQVADVVAENTKYSKEDFMAVMQDDAYLQQLVATYPFLADSYNNENVRYVLEGYLFPATYEFDEEAGLHALVEQMLDKFASVLEKYQSQVDASQYSLQDLMSLASLVEKEGMTPEDRRMIAGVFYNRLQQDMAIQSDISVLYALGTHKELVTFEDLEVDSPYNLYKYTGLPPGPLNSPSEDAISAVLNPEASDYIYFYANIKTGEVFYTADYNQHLAWQEEYESTGDIQGETRK